MSPVLPVSPSELTRQAAPMKKRSSARVQNVTGAMAQRVYVAATPPTTSGTPRVGSGRGAAYLGALIVRSPGGSMRKPAGCRGPADDHAAAPPYVSALGRSRGDLPAPQSCEADRLAVLVGEREVGRELTCFEHPPGLRSTTQTP
jgi:hypothetical protein